MGSGGNEKEKYNKGYDGFICFGGVLGRGSRLMFFWKVVC